MDKNTLTGIFLIGIVLLLFTYISRPSKEQLAKIQQQKDSIAAMQAAAARSETIEETSGAASTLITGDSLVQEAARKTYGSFYAAAQGKEETFTLENDELHIEISNKGARIVNAELKQYDRYDGNPIVLVKNGEAEMNYSFVTAENRVIASKDMYFSVDKLGADALRFSLASDKGAKLSFTYRLRENYLIDLEISSAALENMLAANNPYLDAVWNLPIYQNEKSKKSEDRYAGLAYKISGEGPDKLSTSKAVDKTLNSKVEWLAFRDMFFSTVLYAPKQLEQLALESKPSSQEEEIKSLRAAFSIPVSKAPTNLKIFMGPHDFKLLQKVQKELAPDKNLELTKIVDMGDWFRFINIWIILPVFNFLETITSNYGLIILLLTIFIKLLLSPFTYKSFVSQAKMRVLRPQVEAINAKYPGEDNMMKRQQATMTLYRSAGASTLGGCLPMLLQMPFLIAMYQYFPTSLNLRGESFLWAQDLSTYDDVIRWSADIPIISSLFGNHISLFCLLMTVTQIVYMRISQSGTGQAPMPGMKYLPYITSIMFFVFLNQNASGLSYYYFLSMLITIIQAFIFRYAINEDKLLVKMEANKRGILQSRKKPIVWKQK